MGKQAPIVKEVTPETMLGETPLMKELNAYLTNNFILTHDVPADECLREAKYLVYMQGRMDERELLEYLKQQFTHYVRPDFYKQAAKEVFEMLKPKQ